MVLKMGLFLIIFSSVAKAAIPWGSYGTSLGGATVASPQDAFTVFTNPAGMAEPSLFGKTDKRFLLHYGAVYLNPQFPPISNIVVENEAIGNQTVVSDANPGVDETVSQVIGFIAVLSPNFHRITAGINIYLPYAYLAQFNSGTPFLPNYILYSSVNQINAEFSLAAQLTQGLSIGLLLHSGYSIGAYGDVFISTKSSLISSMLLSGSVKPQVAPALGVRFIPLKGIELGLVLRSALISTNDVLFQSNIKIADLSSAPLVFQASSAVAFDPATLELGAGIDLTEYLKVFLQADYQVYRNYQTPQIQVQASSDGVQFAGSLSPEFDLVNILISRVGFQWQLASQHFLRAGYVYKPSIFKGPPDGIGNYLDLSSSSMRLGYGLLFNDLIPFVNFSFDFYALYTRFNSQTVTKTAGNEVDDLMDQKIGYPGYIAQGHMWGCGVTLGLKF